MSTLIAVYNSEGCVGRCDARCYNAVTGQCKCICQGKNHGAGRDKAIDNTREMAESWVEEIVKHHPDYRGFKVPANKLFTKDEADKIDCTLFCKECAS